MSSTLATVRHEWEEGHRRLAEEGGDRRRHEQLLAEVEVVGRELRRRVGGAFTLAELAAAYRDADSWSRAALSDHANFPGWPRTLSVVVAAAFHLYSREAVDYSP